MGLVFMTADNELYTTVSLDKKPAGRETREAGFYENDLADHEVSSRDKRQGHSSFQNLIRNLTVMVIYRSNIPSPSSG